MLVTMGDRRGRRGASSWARAVAAAAFLLLTLALPVAATSGPNRLFDPAVSPRTGTTTTAISAVIWYRSADASEADWVRVSFDGVSYEMTAQPGGTWKDGIEFRWSGILAVGTGAVVFSAQGRDHFFGTLAAGTVSIVAPTPSPTPTPTPTAIATPGPTPQAGATPTATPKGPAAAAPTPPPTGGPAGPSTFDPNASPSAAGTTAFPGQPAPGDSPVTSVPGSTGDTDSDTSVTAVTGSTGGTGSTGSTGGSGPDGPSDSPTGSPHSTGWGPGGGHTTWGPLTSALSALGINGPSFGGLSMGPMLVTSTGAVAMAMAFGIFGKRRRDGEPPAPDGLLAAAAAGVAVKEILVAPDTVEDLEAAMPRWRRPSLIQARKADPIRDTTPTPRLAFDQALVGPLDGHVRRLIRYRVVRLLDAPDELRGRETGYLDRDDEVELLEKHGAYWLVHCPDGRQGWVHNMTLGEVVGQQVQRDGPVATMPIAAETWTMGDSDADTDVFEAYLESRRRAT